VCAADTRESTSDTLDFSQSRGESAAGLFVLMGLLQNCTNPEARASTLKHFAFTRCGEFNVFGMVDAQIAVVEGELLAHMS